MGVFPVSLIARQVLKNIFLLGSKKVKVMESNLSLWQKYQDWLYYHPDLEFYLDISRINFSQADVEALAPKFDRAFQDMVALESGAIANPDEQRMVGHYWLRNPDLAPNAQLREEIITNIRNIEDFASQVLSGKIKPPNAPKFTDIISIGIGGSALGPQFVSEALAPDVPPLAIHFIDNSDPAGLDRLIHQVEPRLNSTLVIVISKSGSTPEPRNGMLEMATAYQKHGLNFPDYAVAITGIGSQLDQTAIAEKWVARFPMEDWVGGRTSEMSAVGLVPAALQGVDIQGLLAGAKEMDIATRQPSFKNNPAALLAFCWYVEGKGKGEKDMVVLPYKDNLKLFSRYLQQLVMESLGKELDLDGKPVYQGIAVYGNKGSTDQHAYVQQLREGVPNFFMTFVEVLLDRHGPSREIDSNITMGDYLSGFLLGTRTALYEKGRGSICITVQEADARSIGALIALYERAVGFYASLVNVNAYHQPGVEAGKKAAASVLKIQLAVIEVLMQSTAPLSVADIAEKIGEADRVEAIYKIVRHLAANGRAVLEGNKGTPAKIMVIMGDKCADGIC
jgi:glucose-6-phosphate isomerase